MADPNADLLKDLLAPPDDHAWKLAVGATLASILVQTQKTNGRVTKTEGDINRLKGGLVVVGVVLVPLFLGLFR